MDTNKINLLHTKAMKFAQEADRLLRKAYQKEKEAALLLEHDTLETITRSVLFRSAVSLGVQCGQYNEAHDLIEIAIKGKMPKEILDELRELDRTIDKQLLKGK